MLVQLDKDVLSRTESCPECGKASVRSEITSALQVGRDHKLSEDANAVERAVPAHHMVRGVKRANHADLTCVEIRSEAKGLKLVNPQ